MAKFPYGSRPHIELLLHSYPHLRRLGIAGEVMAQLLNEGEEGQTLFRNAHAVLQAYDREGKIEQFLDNKVTSGWEGPGKLPPLGHFYRIGLEANSIESETVKVFFSDGSGISIGEGKFPSIFKRPNQAQGQGEAVGRA